MFLDVVKKFLESKANLLDVPTPSHGHFATAESTDDNLIKGNLVLPRHKTLPEPLQPRKELWLILNQNVAENPRIIQPPIDLVGLLVELVKAQLASSSVQVIGGGNVFDMNRVIKILEVAVLHSLHKQVVHPCNNHIHLLLTLHRHHSELKSIHCGVCEE